MWIIFSCFFLSTRISVSAQISLAVNVFFAQAVIFPNSWVKRTIRIWLSRIDCFDNKMARMVYTSLMNYNILINKFESYTISSFLCKNIEKSIAGNCDIYYFIFTWEFKLCYIRPRPYILKSLRIWKEYPNLIFI